MSEEQQGEQSQGIVSSIVQNVEGAIARVLHPGGETPGNAVGGASNDAPSSDATSVPAASGSSAAGELGNVSPSENSALSDSAPQSVGENSISTSETAVSAAAPSDSTSDSALTASGSTVDDAGNAAQHAAGQSSEVDASAAGDAGNGASAAADLSTEGAGSAPAASSGAGTSLIDENSGDSAAPLSHRVAQHLEAIYRLVQSEADQAVSIATVGAKSDLKAAIEDVLAKMSNGIAVSEHAVVSRLEALLKLL